ncbi:DUF3822 domain-containing protein [Flavobacterium album]|uniref:DUF3822 domain-containing protein n=1 Tax=Flavobacterium album TaxID=2175091 RepID=A0A2S1R0E9_9FLAO|nr:DUF3822 family protein [Flavobacterium album]AWH86095.1 DUF3822 domain-containing protein [Flavobacterium album]
MTETITSKNYKKLSLRIAHNGMSFCCFDTLNWEITSCKSVAFSKYTPIEEELWKAFVNHQQLTRPYDEIMVLHDNSFNTFVPDALFDENYIGSYLQYNTKVFETDFFAFDAIGSYELNNVYVPMMNVNNFLIDQFGAFEYKNVNSVLVAKLLDASKNIDEKQVYVHVQDSHFEIVVVRNQKLLLYNSFEYKTPEDFLYYLLFTMEQLFLNPETAKVSVLGKIDESHPCFTLGYTYIRNIALFDTTALQEKWGKSQHETLEHFILFNS